MRIINCVGVNIILRLYFLKVIVNQTGLTFYLQYGHFDVCLIANMCEEKYTILILKSEITHKVRFHK